MKAKKYKRLTLKERVVIEILLQENKSKTYIAKTLSRSRSTITREVNKWGGDYNATLASWNAKDDYLVMVPEIVGNFSKSNFYILKDNPKRT